METKELYVDWIRLAELQFRLACTVHVAVMNDTQTLDVPLEWSFGKYRVTYDEFGLRRDQAVPAASMLEHTAMLALVSVIHQMFCEVFNKPRVHENGSVVAAYQISKLIRNAFAHSVAAPAWDINSECRGKIFEIEDVIRLDTTDLDGKYFEWQHFGGPLAIFFFARFVREVILESPVDPNRKKPDRPSIEYRQFGRTVMHRMSDDPGFKLPPGEYKVVPAGETVDFGGGFYLKVGPSSEG